MYIFNNLQNLVSDLSMFITNQFVEIEQDSIIFSKFQQGEHHQKKNDNVLCSQNYYHLSEELKNKQNFSRPCGS